MLEGNDLEVSSGCREDVNLPHNRLQRDHLKAFHASLQSANWINLCDQDTSSCPAPGGCREDVNLPHNRLQ